MDPTACRKRWRDAVADDDEEAREAWLDLTRWMRRGDFVLAWTEKEEHAFRCWVPKSKARAS